MLNRFNFPPLMFKRLALGRVRIKKSDLPVEPEEIFMDAFNAPGFRREMHEGRIERPISPYAFVFFSLAVAVFLLVIVARLYDLQIRDGDSLYARAQANKTYPIIIQAPRGILYDRDLEKLVENVPTFVISLHPADIEDDQAFGEEFRRLASLVGRSAAEIAEANGLDTERISEEDLYRAASWPPEIFIASGELREAVLEIEGHPESYAHVALAEAAHRGYFLGQYASHILGYVGRPSREDLQSRGAANLSDLVGKDGLEFQYDQFLRGLPGRKLIEVNASGEPQRERFIVKSSPGKNIVLEIDAGLQRFAASALERHVRALGKKAAAIVAVDPRDGAIRALASFPAYDPNLFGRGTSQKEINRLLADPGKPFFNRAMAGVYPSGSTIKPLLAAAALEEGIIDPQKSIYDPGFISVPNPYDPANPTIFKDWKPLGWVDMRRAIALSANVYFYTVGGGYQDVRGLGIRRIKKFLELFGWGSALGLDLPGEAKGLIPDPEVKKITRPKDPVWRIGDTYITSIGQGDLEITPLQLAAATAAIANGGTLWKPRLAKAVVDDDKNVVREFNSEAIRSGIIRPENLAVVREGMRQAVTEGSAAALGDLFFSSAGKTGTAQTGVYGKNHGWFVGFAPYENPEIVVAVLVEEGTGGSTDAVPIAKEVLYYYFTGKD